MSKRRTRHIIQGYTDIGDVLTINTKTMRFWWLHPNNVPIHEARENIGYPKEGAHGPGAPLKPSKLPRLRRQIVKRILF